MVDIYFFLFQFNTYEFILVTMAQTLQQGAFSDSSRDVETQSKDSRVFQKMWPKICIRVRFDIGLDRTVQPCSRISGVIMAGRFQKKLIFLL